MRLEHIAPRTLLLATFAGWALLAWVLALAGMGSRVPEGKGGAIAGSRLPTLPADGGTAGPGPLGQYGEIAARPLFAVDRRPHPFSLVTENDRAGAPADFDLVLTSVLITPQASIAIVQKPDGSESWRVRIGEAPDSRPGWQLVSLQPRSAVFEGPEGRKELVLRVYDGKGGSAPTAPSVAPAMPTPPVPVPSAMAATPPPTDAATAPDPAQIEQIRQRIEARREEMRRRAQNSTPPAPVAPPPATR